ncbi:hypothetical protein J0H33_00020 [bacterium]|nr:hypothetical protein [bacterium]
MKARCQVSGVLVQNAVAISSDSVGKTISGAKISGQGNDLVLDTLSFYKPTQPGSYPIVLATYEIVCSKGYDAATDEYGDMVSKGIIDPAKVTRSAIENAVSIAALVLTTNCLVTDLPENTPAPMAAPPMY